MHTNTPINWYLTWSLRQRTPTKFQVLTRQHYLNLYPTKISLSFWVLEMAKAGQFFSFFFIAILFISSVFFLAEARPLATTLKVQSPAGGHIDNWSVSLGAVKDGPSPGAGHKYTNAQTLGGIKDGPSPGDGHKVVTGTHNWVSDGSQTFGIHHMIFLVLHILWFPLHANLNSV